MQAYVVLPAFLLVYLWAANASPGRRIRDLAVGTVALVVSIAWWMVAVDLVPAARRPYIGGPPIPPGRRGRRPTDATGGR